MSNIEIPVNKSESDKSAPRKPASKSETEKKSQSNRFVFKSKFACESFVKRLKSRLCVDKACVAFEDNRTIAIINPKDMDDIAKSRMKKFYENYRNLDNLPSRDRSIKVEPSTRA